MDHVRCNEEGKASSCFFRTMPNPPHKKALLQLTTQCNQQCIHCFMKSSIKGIFVDIVVIREKVLPLLKLMKISRITLTGGEPFLHPNFLDIVSLLIENGFRIGICSNGTTISRNIIHELLKLEGDIHINISIHGFSPVSHGTITKNPQNFEKVVNTIRLLGEAGLLQGLLVTPHIYNKLWEFEKLCKFAIKNNARYLLMNPLSPFGRGAVSEKKYKALNNFMLKIEEITFKYKSEIEIVYIRFPNTNKLPLSSCKFDRLIYIFANGDITWCPHFVFASTSRQSRYEHNDFIYGNINTMDPYHIMQNLSNAASRIQSQIIKNKNCNDCPYKNSCGRGCNAIKIARGFSLEEGIDDLCPLHAMEV